MRREANPITLDEMETQIEALAARLESYIRQQDECINDIHEKIAALEDLITSPNKPA